MSVARGWRAGAWKAQPERSTAFWLGLLVWIAIHLGRWLTRVLLWPITLFFLATGGSARRASRGYLRRVLGREPRLGEILRHFYDFATCTVDRLLILSGQAGSCKPPGAPARRRWRGPVRRRGCIMLVSHVGSFEVLRQLGEGGHDMPLRILLDRSQGPLITGLLERFSPQFAASVIDAGKRGPELVLAVRETLDQGISVGIMADRARPGEPAVTVRLLGGEVHLPAAPWLLAAVLQAPVIAAFGIYRGGRDYEAHVELLTAPGHQAATRAERHAVIQALRPALPQRVRELASPRTAGAGAPVTIGFTLLSVLDA